MAKSQKKTLHNICVKLEKILSDLLEMHSGEIINKVLYKTKTKKEDKRKKTGRKSKLTEKQIQKIIKMSKSNKVKTKDIADKFGISTAMVYRYIKR